LKPSCVCCSIRVCVCVPNVCMCICVCVCVCVCLWLLALDQHICSKDSLSSTRPCTRSSWRATATIRVGCRGAGSGWGTALCFAVSGWGLFCVRVCCMSALTGNFHHRTRLTVCLQFLKKVDADDLRTHREGGMNQLH
jgi:hypothetical protein